AAEQDGDPLLLALEVDFGRLPVLPELAVAVIRVRHVRRCAPAVADVDVDEVEQPGLADVVEHLAHLEVVVAAPAELLAADADAEPQIVADPTADAPQRLDHESDALLRAATPAIGALIRDRREERVPERLMGAVHLDA